MQISMWGADEGAGRKVLQGARVILKGRMQVRLGKVARIACLCKQGKVREGQAGRQGTVRGHALLSARTGNPGMDKGAEEEQRQCETYQQHPLAPREGLQTDSHESVRLAARPSITGPHAP